MKKIITTILFLVAFCFSATNYNYLSYNDGLQVKNATDFILEIQPKMYTPTEATDIALNIWEAANASSLEYEYIMAIVMTESRFNYKARSWCGAIGLMQIMPNTFVSVAKKNGLNYKYNDIYDVKKNIEIGVLYLDYLNQKYGDKDLVSAGYNGGPGAANKWKKEQFNRVPKETKKYVKKVNEHHEYFIFKLNENSENSEITG